MKVERQIPVCLSTHAAYGHFQTFQAEVLARGTVWWQSAPCTGGKGISAHWLSCNKSLCKGLPALSGEHKRGSTRWDETVGVSEGFDPSSSGITKENTPSLLHSECNKAFYK